MALTHYVAAAKDPKAIEKAAAVLDSLGKNDALWDAAADTTSPFVKTGLLRVKGQRLFRDGKFDAAERAFAQVAKNYAKQAKHSPAAANNAALMHQNRFACTGKVELLAEAVGGLEAALRLAPDNALVLGNLAAAYAYDGKVRVLEQWIDPGVLRPDSRETDELLLALADGPMHSEVTKVSTQNASLLRSADLTRQEAVLAPNSASAYSRQAQWFSMQRDVESLKKLQKQLESVKDFDNTQAEEIRAAYQGRTEDARFLEQIDASLLHLQKLEAAAKKRNHAPTLAALYYLRGIRLRDRAEITDGINDAQNAVDALRQCNRIWRKLDGGRRLAWALVELAILKAGGVSGEAATYRRDNVRKYSLAVLLHRALANPETEAIIAAVRKQAELGEATRLRKAGMLGRPVLTDWALARFVGDSAYEKSAALVFGLEDQRAGAEITTRLDPSSPSAKAIRDMMVRKN